MPRGRTNPDYLNGVPELLILKLLSRRAMHGYELVQAIPRSSDGSLEFGEGCVYPLLHRLEREKAVVGQRQDVGGRSRVVYRITAAGRQRLRHSVSRWEEVVGAVRKVLQGGAHGQAKLA